MSASTLYDLECVMLATLIVGFGLAGLVRVITRPRPGLSIGRAVAIGMALRFAAFVGMSAGGFGAGLRGGDETTFLNRANEIAGQTLSSGVWFPGDTRIHEILFALQIKLADFPADAMRVTQLGLAMIGIVLLLAAVYDLAGPRAAHLGAWVLALEPSSIFFHGLLMREPLLVLASGLVVLGGAKVWTKLELRGILLLGVGCAIATGTRPYAGWFLIGGALLLTLHAALRQTGRLRSVPLVYGVAITIAVAAPALTALTSPGSLQRLQNSQDANTSDSALRGQGSSDNLALEAVDYSTRSAVLTNLPRRIRDIVLRPYPWQVQNASQLLGALGSLIVLAALYLLFRYARRNRGQILARSAPMLYPLAFLTVAYALSVGNAGTGFRYRTQLVTLGLVVLVVLREHAMSDAPSRKTVDSKATSTRDPRLHLVDLRPTDARP